jgi:TonB family protein
MAAALYEELDQAIDQLMDDTSPRVSGELTGLISLAGELRQMPSTDFRARLASDLQDQAMFIAAGRAYQPPCGVSARVFPMPATTPLKPKEGLNGAPTSPLPLKPKEGLNGPPMFSTGPATYPAKRMNFMISALLHTMALAFVLTSGMWMYKNQVVDLSVSRIHMVEPDLAVVAPKPAGGGGGGGDRDKVDTPKGKLPKTAMEQITPPAMVIRNDHPQLAVTPTVVAPPVNIATNMPNIGDPFSRIPSGPPSNGTGSSGGIGSGDGGGVGIGRGPGIGAGTGGGIGGGVFKVGGGVSAPRALYAPDPDYSEEARQAKYQGTVVLWLVVGPDGRPRDAKISRSLGMGLDEKALEAVRRWKFEPAMKDGKPVAVQINVEMNFRLY